MIADLMPSAKIDHEIWHLGWAFKYNFGPEGWEFEQTNL